MENYLFKNKIHPYIGRKFININQDKFIYELNKSRDNSRGCHLKVVYYYEVLNDGEPMKGLANAAKMILEHGTVKSWSHEGGSKYAKPDMFDENMSWIESINLIEYNSIDKIESGILTICYPTHFFDKVDSDKIPLSQIMMAIASEPFSAFSFYQGAKVIDIIFPEELLKRFKGVEWTNERVRNYLEISSNEPIIGTIVKPKAGLTPQIFADSVVEAAVAGARFTKADENMHLRMNEINSYVSKVVKDLEREGFSLDKDTHKSSSKKKFIFAPHITANQNDMMECARIAVESGANALMFSPYYGGGFELMNEITEKFDVPVYAHTAGMNPLTGCYNWGFDHSIMYRLAALYGAAFMQLTAVRGYLKPDDIEKSYILEKLERDKLIGDKGMTIVIAGGIGASNIGINMKELGVDGKMFLAGTSVYSHPNGAGAGVKSIIKAYEAYISEGLTEVSDLIEYGKSLGSEGLPLVQALEA